MGFEIVEEPPEQSWREALRLRPDALPFQSPELFEVHRQAHGVEPGALVAVEQRSGRGLACLVWTIVRPSARLARPLLTRCICQGGPVYRPGDELGLQAARALVERHVRLVRGRAIYSQFRNAYEGTGIPEVLEDLGFDRECQA